VAITRKSRQITSWPAVHSRPAEINTARSNKTRPLARRGLQAGLSARDGCFWGAARMFPSAPRRCIELKKQLYTRRSLCIPGLKHGPIALIRRRTFQWWSWPQRTRLFDKTVRNMQEVRRAKGKGHLDLGPRRTGMQNPKANMGADRKPSGLQMHSPRSFMPIPAHCWPIILPSQGDRCSTKPRNLAKSVTVENELTPIWRSSRIG